MSLTETEKIIIQMKMLELGLIPYLGNDKYTKFYTDLEASNPKQLNIYKRKFRKIKRLYAKKYKLDPKLVTKYEIIYFIAADVFPNKKLELKKYIVMQDRYKQK